MKKYRITTKVGQLTNIYPIAWVFVKHNEDGTEVWDVEVPEEQSGMLERLLDSDATVLVYEEYMEDS